MFMYMQDAMQIKRKTFICQSRENMDPDVQKSNQVPFRHCDLEVILAADGQWWACLHPQWLKSEAAVSFRNLCKLI